MNKPLGGLVCYVNLDLRSQIGQTVRIFRTTAVLVGLAEMLQMDQ